MVSEQEELAMAGRLRGKWWLLGAVMVGVAFIFACIVAASNYHVVRYGGANGATYGNCQPNGELSSVICTPAGDFNAYGDEQIVIGAYTYGNCQPNGDKRVVSNVLSTTVTYDSIVCYRLDG